MKYSNACTFSQLHNLFSLLSCSKLLFDPVEDAAGYEPLPEDRPGGFPWGDQQQPEQEQQQEQQNNDPH